MRPKSPWTEAHTALKQLWDERIAPTGMSQEEFGERYGIGTQTMVSQYALHAIRRLVRAMFCLSALALAACATPAPDKVTVRWVRVDQAEIHKVCGKQHGAGAIVLGHYRGCSTWNRDAGVCTIWAPDFPEVKQRELMATLGHELKHCFDGPWH